MSIFLHPLKDPGDCQRRGHHGPFTNTELYANFPGWEGMGECARCGSTVVLPSERPARSSVFARSSPEHGS